MPNRTPNDSMESPESYLPPTSVYQKYFCKTSLDEIYSLDEFSYPVRFTSDQDLIEHLASIRQRWKEMFEHGVTLEHDPDLHASLRRFLLKPRAAAAMKAALEGWKTDHGEWSQKNTFAIPNTFQVNSPDSPKFLGTKTTLGFIPTGAKKPVLGMTQYNMLSPRENSDGLYLDEELSLCHLFPLEPKKPYVKRQRSGCAAGQFNDVELSPTHEWKEELSNFDMTNHAPLGVDDYSVDVPRQPWDNFTKIYTKNPKLMYAACNRCNTMLKLKGGASCGTKSLINHSEAFKCKHKQLPGNTSLMPVPSIALDGHHGITTSGVVEIRGISVEIGMPQ